MCGFAHLHGHRVGILANQGVIFSSSALKGAHFIEMCDQRGIPLVFLQNITGFMVGKDAEAGGIAKDGAKMIAAVSVTRVPKLTVIVGGSFGAGNYGMCGRPVLPALPVDVAERAHLGHGRRAGRDRADDGRPREGPGGDRGAQGARSASQYETQGHPYYASARLWDDGVIHPDEHARRARPRAVGARQRAAARAAQARLPDVKENAMATPES